MNKKLYLAGPLFTTAERQFNKLLAVEMIILGFDVWLPQENEPRSLTCNDIFLKDVEGVDWCDVIVANMDGPDPDSGTCWECGYAYKKKLILCYRTDFRSASDGTFAPFNLMLAGSANAIKIFSMNTDIKTIAKELSEIISTLVVDLHVVK